MQFKSVGQTLSIISRSKSWKNSYNQKKTSTIFFISAQQNH